MQNLSDLFAKAVQSDMEQALGLPTTPRPEPEPLSVEERLRRLEKAEDGRTVQAIFGNDPRIYTGR